MAYKSWDYRFEKVVFREPQLLAELHGPTGGLWKYLDRRSAVALANSKQLVGVKTGRLRKSLHVRHLATPYGQVVKIGSDVPYAYMHHRGTPPHLIMPDKAPELVFFGKSGTGGMKLIRTQLVRHPGTKANRYLSSQLRMFTGTKMPLR